MLPACAEIQRTFASLSPFDWRFLIERNEQWRARRTAAYWRVGCAATAATSPAFACRRCGCATRLPWLRRASTTARWLNRRRRRLRPPLLLLLRRRRRRRRRPARRRRCSRWPPNWASRASSAGVSSASSTTARRRASSPCKWLPLTPFYRIGSWLKAKSSTSEHTLSEVQRILSESYSNRKWLTVQPNRFWFALKGPCEQTNGQLSQITS